MDKVIFINSADPNVLRKLKKLRKSINQVKKSTVLNTIAILLYSGLVIGLEKEVKSLKEELSRMKNAKEE